MRAMREGDFEVIKNGVGSNKDPQWELYNVVDDPGESNGLATAMPHKFKAMTESFAEWDDALPEPEFFGPTSRKRSCQVAG